MDAVCERVRRVAVTCRDDDHCVPDVDTFMMTNIDIIMSEALSSGGIGGEGGDVGGGGGDPTDITPTLVTGSDQWSAVEVR